jgi:hypothetical protein
MHPVTAHENNKRAEHLNFVATMIASILDSLSCENISVG